MNVIQATSWLETNTANVRRIKDGVEMCQLVNVSHFDAHVSVRALVTKEAEESTTPTSCLFVFCFLFVLTSPLFTKTNFYLELSP